MAERPNLEENKFKSPEEELVYLRNEVARHERESIAEGVEKPRDTIVREKIQEYKALPADSVLTNEHKLSWQEKDALSLGLSPESHDTQMSELMSIMNARGIKNALSVLEKMHNPHLEDDFERLLVQYVKAGYSVGLKEKDPVFKALHMTLYEITLPEPATGKSPRSLKEIVSSMEQFYAGMLTVGEELTSGPNYFTIEISVANHSDEFVFYAAVPDSRKSLFEKQILSIFHNAKISERKDDYNIFSETGVSVGSSAVSSRSSAYPLKTYEQFDHDPLNVILNSFSKIDKDGEGAAIQIIINPVDDRYTKKYKYALDEINKGKKINEVLHPKDGFVRDFFGVAKEIAFGVKPKKEEKENELPKIDTVAAENIKSKIGSPIVETSIRIIASSNDEESAREILKDLESAFNQFENSHGNKLAFDEKKRGELADLLHSFSFRLFSADEAIPLSIKEITSLMHFPSSIMRSAPQLKIAKAGSAPAPAGLPNSGTLLGINRNRNVETEIYMSPEDRLRHFYVVGQTGTGKTTILKNMIAQDILRGDGVCMIDPHGSDIQDILAIVPPERYEDVIYFDPSYTARPMALNMLEYDGNFPEQKTFVVNEMLSIFSKLFDMKTAGGPMFEQYFRNAVLLVLDKADSGSTLLDISRVLADKAFRSAKLAECRNPLIVQFWKEVAEKAGGEAALANIVPYITSKFDVFLTNDIMRPIISQSKSSFNFREIMDNKKILLVNLAKGRLGDINSHLIGLVLVGKILMAALSRVDSLGANLPPFYLYIDEFQNITTDSIATILSEARKYKLSLNIAHQFIAQIDEKIKDAVFGNVGSLATFRVGAEDAEYLVKQYEPTFSAQDIMNLDNFNAYVKLLAGGKPVKPFNIETFPTPKGNRDNIDRLKELSYLKFGKERSVVEAEIMAKYQNKSI